ncbi:MAG: YbgC/FadM family acyl-CoA thioesterase [Chitinivibrionales bacterium]|nr:YbgC/FadM family acyl-CoA thioesterase [Chitinivibrionales bacterium]
MALNEPNSGAGHCAIRVYYEDTDCGNVVYYANYLSYMERGRTELMRQQGIHLAEFHRSGCIFIVSEAHVKYHSSARYDDLLDVETCVSEVSGASLRFISRISKADGAVLVSGEVRLACVNARGDVQRVPEKIVQKLTAIKKTGVI